MSKKLVLSKTNAWLAWSILTSFYLFQCILRVLPNIIIEDLIEHYKINTTIFGQISGVYYIGYSLAHLPLGILLSRIGIKKIMLLCLIMIFVGLLPLIYSTEWIYILLGRILIGIGSCGAALGLIDTIHNNFPSKRFSSILSLGVTIGLIGSIYGGAPLMYIKNYFGYHMLIKILGICTLALAAISYMFLPDQKAKNSDNIFQGIKTVLFNKKILFACFMAGFMLGPIEGFADAWGKAFFMKIYHLNEIRSSAITSMVFFGFMFGPLVSIFAEKYKLYLSTIIGCGIVMCILFSSVLIFKIPTSILYIIFFLIGVCVIYQILVIYKVSTYVGGDLSTLASTVANMIIMIFGYFFHTIIGYIINIFGGMDNPQAFIYGMYTISIALVIGIIGFFILKNIEKNSINL